jgi:hypothetical protein
MASQGKSTKASEHGSLKDALEGQVRLASVKVVCSEADYREAKQLALEACKLYAVRRSKVNKTYAAWKHARVELLRAQRRLSSVSSRSRSWARDNPGKVFAMMEKLEQKR